MEGGFQLKHDNPKKKANYLSRLTFAWLIKLYYKGVKKGLEVLDLYKVLDGDSSEKLGDRLEKNWENQIKYARQKGGQPSLLKALTKTFFWGYMVYGIALFILHGVIRAYQPVVLAYLIGLFMRPGEDDVQTKMYIAGSIMVGMSTVTVFMNHHINFFLASVGMRLRISCSTLLYRKILKLSQKSRSQTATGQVVNLLSNDVSRFDLVTISLHYLWIMPLNAAVITYFIWQEVQISALAGVVSMALISIPVQGYLGKVTSQLRLKVAQRTDHRVKLMSEIIDGIQVIKMYAWEKPFEQIVKIARRKEINTLTSASYLRGIYLSSMVFVERAALFLTVVCYVLLGNVISADKVFSMAQFFNMLQLMMAIFYPMAITYGAESLVAVRRLQEFLVMEEIGESMVQTESSKGIKVDEVDASWVGGTPNLENVNLDIKPGTLCAIVGPVGAGKSSILQLLLSELKPSVGTVTVGGEMSYAAQEPWLFVSTVRNNILFGQPYDKDLYKAVVKVCALEKDFDQFPQRDKTMVGERGVSLSGGQRARINLARAVYRSADIYLLDDPLSAVDTHVGRHLFDECIVKYLTGKTRILVTHQLQYLKKADMIIVVNNGKIEAHGTFDELSNSELDFTKMFASYDETETEKKTEFERRSSILSTLSLKSEIGEDEAGQLEEERIPAKTSALADYFSSAGNICKVILLVVILILGQVACSAADYWITFWTQQEAVRHSNTSHLIPVTEDTPILERVEYYGGDGGNLSESMHPYYTYTVHDDLITETLIVDDVARSIVRTNVAIYIYSGLIVAAIIVTLMRSFLFFKICMTSSKNLHKKMFNALLQAPMRFFDTNPSGRILNRFSKDMGAIDEILPRTLLEAIQITLVMCGILVMVTVSNYYMIVIIVILGSLFWKLRTYYIKTAKDVKHIEGITKSPVFSHLNSSINGLVTIRASKAESVLRKEFDAHQDVHTSAWYLTLACIFSFGLWLDIICVIFLACIVYSFIILSNYIYIDGSLVGLAISQSIILTGMLQYGIRQTAEVVNQLISVERIMQYTKLDREGPFETPQKEKNITRPWPEKGLIQFKNMYLRYSISDPPVLKNLNLTILPGEKVGIVGRTGAGKSSLISALFRLTNIEGSIVIDGVNTKDIGLHDLRKKISIIPQEPVLFSATLRYNLDPFYEYDDDKLWNALEEVELKDAVPSLDYLVSHGGTNFSLGQRQLLCLARAILRNNRILVLDEATANVDPRTDSLIQATIRKKFKHCTVLTIAHRLNTIMDSHKVLVMSSGYAVEFDHPHILLQDEQGYFSRMVAQTGSSMENQLKAIAENAYLVSEDRTAAEAGVLSASVI